MSDNLLQTDEVLERLTEELLKFKASSEQLALVSENVGQLLESTTQLTRLSGEVLDQGKKQLDSVVQVSSDTEQRVNEAMNHLRVFTESIDNSLQNEVQPALRNNADAITQVSTDTAKGFDTLMERQQILTESITTTLQETVQPVLDETQRLSSLNRTLIIGTLILVIVNMGLAVYIVTLLTGT